MKRSLLFLILFLPAFSLNVLSAVVFRSGSVIKESREALESYLFEKAMRLSDSVLMNSNNPLSRLEAKEIKARAAAEIGLISLAEKYYKEATEEAKELLGEEAPGYLNSLYNYAMFLMQTGRYEDCLEVTENINYANDEDLSIDILGLKSSAHLWLGNSNYAFRILDYTIKKCEQDQIPDKRLPILYQNRGFLESKTNNHARAVADYMIAIEGLEGKSKGAALANLAISQAHLGNYDEALSNADKALEILKNYGSKDEDYVIALRKKAEVLSMAGHDKQAAEIMKQFFNLEKNRLIDILPSLSPQTRLNYWTREKPSLSKIFLTSGISPELSLDAALLRRQTSLMGGNNIETTVAKLSETGADIAKRLKDNEAAVAFVVYSDNNGRMQNAALTLDNKGKTKFVPLFPQDSIFHLYKDGTSLYQTIISSDPQYKDALYQDSVLAESLWHPVLQALPEGVTTIHFAPEGIFHLWAIENMPFPGKENLSLVRHFALNDIRDEEQKLEAAHILIGGGFNYDTTTDTTVDSNESQRRQTEAYDQLVRTASLKKGERIFQYLPGTLKEATSLHDIYPDSELRTNLGEEELKERADEFDVIHLSTHGYTLSNRIDLDGRYGSDEGGYDMTLWLSGIALNGANVEALGDGMNDGILSAREICDLDLSRANLVVLSACQTAQGLITDESASGLIRALKNAGASTIVATLWEVDDASTALFMKNFHNALKEGMTKTDAFKQAQELTKNHVKTSWQRKFNAGALASRVTDQQISRNIYESPWYWAPFILIDP